MRFLSESYPSSLLILVLVLVLAACCFIPGLILSTSTWVGAFDLGWLVVALGGFLTVSNLIELRTARVKDFTAIYWPLVPGFVLEWLSDLSLHNFRLRGTPEDLMRFAIFSSTFLVFITATTVFSRSKLGMMDLDVRDKAIMHGAVWIGSSVIATCIVSGTIMTFVRGMTEPLNRLVMLESWFYRASLVVLFFLTLKLMLPVILRSIRAVFSQKNSRA
ncbi:MAG: hypothetical protein WBD67_00330 [Terracidiphilus sp.]